MSCLIARATKPNNRSRAGGRGVGEHMGEHNAYRRCTWCRFVCACMCRIGCANWVKVAVVMSLLSAVSAHSHLTC